MIIMAMIVLSMLTYHYAESLLHQEISTKVENQLSTVTALIEGELAAHAKSPVTLARAIEATADHIEQEAMIDIIMKFLSSNDETFGVGVWFEPGQYKSYMEYFGPYAYRYNGQVQYTLESSTKEYDYFNRDFYLIGKATDQSVVWTKPYYEESSQAIVLTASAPFYHYNRSFRGVVSANIHFNKLQSMIEAVNLGNEGDAFLVDADGLFIASQSGDELLNQSIMEHDDPQLVELGRQLLAQSSGLYDAAGNDYIYFFREVPSTGWKIVMSISKEELYRSLEALLLRSILLIAVTLIVSCAVVFYFARYMKHQMRKINLLSSTMARGDFTSSVEISSQDEFARLASDLNILTTNLREVVGDINKGSDLVLRTSALLNTSTDQTTKATAEIVASIEHVASGSEAQVDILQESNVQIVNAANQLSAIADQIKEVSHDSYHSMQTARAGYKAISSSIEQMREIEVMTSFTASSLDSLSQKSQEIDYSMDMIKKIAGTTKVLALNSSIVATRAGTHGKSFLVISEEIKTLAEHTEHAITQIQKTIEQIQLQIASSKEAMDGTSLIVSSGKTTIETAGQAFGEIVVVVEKNASATEQMNTSIQAMTQQISELVERLNGLAQISIMNADQTRNVSASTEEQLAYMEEIAVSAKNLSSLANDLNRTIMKYVV